MKHFNKKSLQKGFQGLATLAMLNSSVNIGGIAYAYDQLSDTDISNFIVENNTIVGVKDKNLFKGKKIDIPQSINNQEITSIGKEAFKDVGLDEVTIPSSVTSVGDSAFYGNELNDLNLSNVKSIGSHAFQKNTLDSVDFNSSIDSLGDYAFANNNLTNVDISKTNISQLSPYAFYDNKINIFTYGSTLRFFKDSALADNNLTNIEIKDSVESIDNNVFKANRLSKVNIPNSITSFGKEVFADNDKLVRVYTSNQNISSEVISDKSGHVVNPINIIYKFVDDNNNTIQADRIIGDDSDEPIFEANKEYTIKAFDLEGYSHNKNITFTPTGDNFVLTVPYTKDNYKPFFQQEDDNRDFITKNKTLNKLKSYGTLTEEKLLDGIKATDSSNTDLTKSIKINKITYKDKDYSNLDFIDNVDDNIINLDVNYTVKNDYGETSINRQVTLDKTKTEWLASDFTFETVSQGVIVNGFSDEGLAKFEDYKDVVLPTEDSEGNKVVGVGRYNSTPDNLFSDKTFKSITIPESSDFKYLYNNAFSDVTIKKDLVLPDNITIIYPYAFKNAELANVVMTDNVTRVGEEAFRGATLKTVTWSKNATEFNTGVFQYANVEHIYNSFYVTKYAANSFLGTQGIKHISTRWDDTNFAQNNSMNHFISDSLDKDKNFYDTLFMNWDTTSIGSSAFSNSSLEGDFTLPPKAVLEGGIWFNNTKIDTFNFSYNILSNNMNLNAPLQNESGLDKDKTIRFIFNKYYKQGTAFAIGPNNPKDFYFGSDFGVISDSKLYENANGESDKALNALTSIRDRIINQRNHNPITDSLSFDTQYLNSDLGEGCAFNNRNDFVKSNNIYILGGIKSNIASFYPYDKSKGVNIHYISYMSSTIPNQYYTDNSTCTAARYSQWGAVNKVYLNMGNFYEIEDNAFNIGNLFGYADNDSPFLGSDSMYSNMYGDITEIGNRPIQEVILNNSDKNSNYIVGSSAFRNTKATITFENKSNSLGKGQIRIGDKAFFNTKAKELNFDSYSDSVTFPDFSTAPAETVDTYYGTVALKGGDNQFGEMNDLKTIRVTDITASLPENLTKRESGENVVVYTHSKKNINNIADGKDYVVDPGYLVSYVDENGKKITDDDLFTGKILEDKSISPKEISGYTTDSKSTTVTANVNDNNDYVKGLQKVTFVYKKASGSEEPTEEPQEPYTVSLSQDKNEYKIGDSMNSVLHIKINKEQEENTTTQRAVILSFDKGLKDPIIKTNSNIQSPMSGRPPMMNIENLPSDPDKKEYFFFINPNVKELDVPITWEFDEDVDVNESYSIKANLLEGVMPVNSPILSELENKVTSNSINFKGYNNPKVKFRFITKDGNPIPNMSFTFDSDNNTLLFSVRTDENGVVLTETDFNKYSISQSWGYKNFGFVNDFSVDTTNKKNQIVDLGDIVLDTDKVNIPFNLCLYNIRDKENLYSLKPSNRGFNTWGQSFELYDSNNNLIKTLDENISDGSLTLKPDTYTLKCSTLEEPYSFYDYTFIVNEDSTITSPSGAPLDELIFPVFYSTSDKVTVSASNETIDWDYPPVIGAKFGVFNKLSGELISTKETDENGQISWYNLPKGDYIIKEISAPLGSVLRGDEHDWDSEGYREFSVDEYGDVYCNGSRTSDNNVTYTLTDITPVINNVELIADNLTKEQAESLVNTSNGYKVVKNYIGNYKVVKPIADSKFTISSNGTTQEVTTDSNGEAKFTYSPNTVSIKQEEVSSHYLLNQGTTNIDLTKINKDELTYDYNNGFINYYIYNNVSNKGRIILAKMSSNKEVLSGVKFGLYSNDKLIKEATTNDNGLILFDNLDFGDYVIKEIETLDNYILYENPINVSLSEENTEIHLNLFNNLKTKNIQIKVSDKDSNTPLDNTEFVLIDKKTGLVYNRAYSLNGIISFMNVPLGDYLLRESKVPSGYKLPNGQEEINLNNDSEENTQVDVANEKQLLPQTGSKFILISALTGLLALASYIKNKNKK